MRNGAGLLFVRERVSGDTLQFDHASLGDVRNPGDFREDVFGQRLVEIQHGCGTAAARVAAEGHIGDVHTGFADGRRDSADDEGFILVETHENATLGPYIDPGVINDADPRVLVGTKQGAGNLVFALIGF